MIGRIEEGKEGQSYGHVSALAVARTFRRHGIASNLMSFFETQCKSKRLPYIDLFVRPSNTVAIKMYQRLGYVVHQIISEYYKDVNRAESSEDALEMRKALSK